jgi:hypothetical protein
VVEDHIIMEVLEVPEVPEAPEVLEVPEDLEVPEVLEVLRAPLLHPIRKHPHAGTTFERFPSTTMRRIVLTPTVGRRSVERCSKRNPPRGRRGGPSITISERT